ncbi:PadR family transcriptional regulator [Candidatus Woesearchaeota archaeon]|nr:PadR family transcriptional regulator [Candidatus Woesearchaeota archaeon]
MGCLRLAVLRQLSKRPLSGYSIMQAITDESGWKPSPGSIYPLLASLVGENLATVRSQGRRRIYALTKEGTDTLQELLGQNRARLDRLASQLRICSPPLADKDRLAVIERLSKGDAPFGWLTRDLLELRRLAFAVTTKDIREGERREIRKAIALLLDALRRAS